MRARIGCVGRGRRLPIRVAGRGRRLCRSCLALRRATDLPMQTIVATSLAVIALVSGGGVVASAIGGMSIGIALPLPPAP